MRLTLICLITLGGAVPLFPQSSATSVGMFEGSGDVGTVLHRGSVKFDPASKAYTVTGSGQNIWAAEDDFQFVWKKISAEDVTLAADIQMLGTDGDRHRKGVLMIRQSLDLDSAYADVAVHGDGLTSLQFRGRKGGATQEIESNVSGPKRVEIEKSGDHFSMWIGSVPRELEFAGALESVSLTAPFYVGIGVSAHDKDAIQSMVFANVELTSADRSKRGVTRTFSTITTINVRSSDARVSYVTPDKIDSAEWSGDGKSLVYSAAGKSTTIPASLYGTLTPSTLPVSPKAPDKWLSPDGTQRVDPIVCVVAGTMLKPLGDPDRDDCWSFAVTSLANKTSKVLMRVQGGSISEHPWSPDGKRVVYVSYQAVIQP